MDDTFPPPPTVQNEIKISQIWMLPSCAGDIIWSQSLLSIEFLPSDQSRVAPLIANLLVGTLSIMASTPSFITSNIYYNRTHQNNEHFNKHQRENYLKSQKPSLEKFYLMCTGLSVCPVS